MSVPLITVEQRRARLARRHRLVAAEHTDDVPRLVDDVIALHSSDPVSVYLSALIRMRTPSVAAVDEALHRAGGLIRHHAMRRTLWVATPATMPVLHAACTRRIAAEQRRRLLRILSDSGIEDPDGWLAAARDEVVEALTEKAPQTARAIGLGRPHLATPLILGAGTKWQTTQSGHSRVLLQLGFEGEVVRDRPLAGWTTGGYTWNLMRARLPGGVDPDLTEAEAAIELADRWLRRFGPATADDLQWWAGWTRRLTMTALDGCGAVPVRVEDGVGLADAWAAPDDPLDEPGAAHPDGAHWVELLPSLDPTVMGWKHRAWYLPPTAADAFDRNGNAGPTIWSDGRVVGAWRYRPPDEGTAAIRLHWFEPVTERVRRAAERRAAELVDVLDGARYTVRFPGRIEARLRAP